MSSSPSLLCQDEVAEHVVNHQPGARVSSDFATFPSTTFVKVSAATDKLSLLIISLFSWEFIEEGEWFRGLTTLYPRPADLTLNSFLSSGEGGEADRLGAGGSGHGAVSPRSGADPPPRPVTVSAAESSQSAADLSYTCPVILPAAPTKHHHHHHLSSSAWQPGLHSRAKQVRPGSKNHDHDSIFVSFHQKQKKRYHDCTAACCPRFTVFYISLSDSCLALVWNLQCALN